MVVFMMRRKCVIALVSVMAICTCIVAEAFNFPSPDWGALLDEKTKMAKEPSFELFSEGPLEAAPYYGARLEPRAGTYFGSVTEYSSVFSQPVGSYLTYFEMSIGQEDIYYPANEIIRQDSGAVVTVGFTVTDINNVNFESFARSLDNLASYNRPTFIRFANEMNVSQIGDEPETYKAIFRKAADIIHQYPNFAVVWSPNDMGALDRPFEYYYPGDEYVDWIGISSYMKKYFQGNKNTDNKSKRYFMIDEYAWHTTSIKPIIKFMQDNNINKPVMISEGGVSYYNKYGEDNTWWALPRIKNMYWNLIMEYPQVKLINYFNVHRQYEPEYFDISNNSVMIEAVNEAVNSGAYIRRYGENPEFSFVNVNAGHTFSVKDGAVPLYVSAYVPENQDITVTYKVDGVWYHSSNSIPYKCGLATDALSNGAHTLEILTNTGLSKTYTFYKNGNRIRFWAEPEVEVGVYVNGEKLNFDQPPVIENGRTLVPMRMIFEALGAEVIWDQNSFAVTAKRGNDTIVMGIGNMFFWLNDTMIPLDVPPKIINGRTLVPARAVSEALECDVSWDGATSTVNIIQ